QRSLSVPLRTTGLWDKSSAPNLRNPRMPKPRKRMSEAYGASGPSSALFRV
ncbi:hypothetical protein V490_00558, partial [Pseudogymnoascus sp. VKM F-3557]